MSHFCAYVTVHGSIKVHTVMGKRKKDAVSSMAATLLGNFGRGTLRDAAEFLQMIEKRRRRYKSVKTELTPLCEGLEARIREAFAGVTCHREVRVLLGGEAEDEYLPANAQALLSPLEERDDWQDIPDDLLFACSCSLSYAGPHAYRFLIPRFMMGALHGVVDLFYPGCSPNRDRDFIQYMRWQCAELNEAQQACLTDYLNLEVVEQECCQRERFLPWELDEYAAAYASSLSYAEYGELLVRRFRESVQMGCEPEAGR